MTQKRPICEFGRVVTFGRTKGLEQNRPVRGEELDCVVTNLSETQAYEGYD